MGAVLAYAQRVYGRLAGYFARKGIRYWATAIVVFIISLYATHPIEQAAHLDSVRYSLFQFLTEATRRQFLDPQFVKVLMIEDQDYFGPALGGRFPIKRRFLAQLIRQLDSANVPLIALDYDMGLDDPYADPQPGDFKMLGEYEDETKEFMETVEDVAKRRKIVLARVMTLHKGRFQIAADAYPIFGICDAQRPDGTWDNPGLDTVDGPNPEQFKIDPVAKKNISCGHITLPVDKMSLALSMPQAHHHGRIDSLALAIVRAHSPYTAQMYDGKGAQFYSSYIPSDLMNEYGIVVRSDQFLRDPAAARDALFDRMVIIGPGYNRYHRSINENEWDDMHDTTSERLPGALVHANFVEAMLKARTYNAVPNWLISGVEILFAVVAALFFAAYSELWVKITFFFVFFAIALLAQWFMMGMFGTYFDAPLPLLALALHSIIDRLFESRR